MHFNLHTYVDEQRLKIVFIVFEFIRSIYWNDDIYFDNKDNKYGDNERFASSSHSRRFFGFGEW